MDYARILQILGRKDAEVHSVFRCGSRVYGTATASSDEDFVAVLARRDAGRDLLFKQGSNIIIHGADSFREALASQSVFALECLFAPPEHRLKETKPGFTFKLDRGKLADSAISRSTSDFTKAGKRFEEEPMPSKKKLFHALRVPMFALQVARQGRIGDYGQANHHWIEIRDNSSDSWEDYERVYAPVQGGLFSELRALASRRG